MDALPHARLPWTRGHKTLIVDREPRVLVTEGTLHLTADLEVRAYDDTTTGATRRVATLAALSPLTIGPRLGLDLAPDLAPLAELAGWLGLLRWIRRTDPAGWTRELTPASPGPR
jgi:hypothetical protein